MKKTYNASEILCYETHPLNLIWNEETERLAKDHFHPEEPRDEKGKWTNDNNFAMHQNKAATKQKTSQTKPPEWEAVIRTNMKIAYNKCHLDKNFLSKENSLWWFYNMVHNKAPWDYKNHLDKNGKQHTDWEDFGNFNYGAVGTACGFPEQMLLRGAGWAQKKSGNWNPTKGEWWDLCLPSQDNDTNCAYGDDPDDQEQIKKGILYAKKCGY